MFACNSITSSIAIRPITTCCYNFINNFRFSDIYDKIAFEITAAVPLDGVTWPKYCDPGSPIKLTCSYM